MCLNLFNFDHFTLFKFEEHFCQHQNVNVKELCQEVCTSRKKKKMLSPTTSEWCCFLKLTGCDIILFAKLTNSQGQCGLLLSLMPCHILCTEKMKKKIF